MKLSINLMGRNCLVSEAETGRTLAKFHTDGTFFLDLKDLNEIAVQASADTAADAIAEKAVAATVGETDFASMEPPRADVRDLQTRMAVLEGLLGLTWDDVQRVFVARRLNDMENRVASIQGLPQRKVPGGG